jgi:ribosomal protein S18 acetylase RimI-like enzyme
MAKYQPEGGHAPLSADHPLYAKAIAGLLVAEVSLERLACKAKLGQNRAPEERRRVLEQLWERGAPGDVEAVACLLARFPELGTPSFLRLSTALEQRGLRLQCGIAGRELDEALALLEGLSWLSRVPHAEIRSAITASTAVVAARDASGALVGFARALSDGKCAWIYDVAVAPHLRSGGIGHALMTVLLDHPSVRHARHVRLSTRDAMPFYRRLGFSELAEAPRYPWTSTEMIRVAPRAVVRAEAVRTPP